MLAAVLPFLRDAQTQARPPYDPMQRIAAQAEKCLRLEVETWPKPGLVSHVDSGSHTDMDVNTFRRSASALRPYFAKLAAAGAQGVSMAVLRKIGVRAECAMMAVTGGVNTHRGAIFGVGLLCAAAGAQAALQCEPHVELGALVTRHWGTDIGAGPRPVDSHGVIAAHRYGVGGARVEAALGFPSVYEIGLPALREAARVAAGGEEAMRVHACFALIAVVEDTNLLHRGGAEGLRFAQRTAQDFLRQGGVAQPGWRASAQAAHTAFVARNLSPGGSADLLAMSLFVHNMS
jgi:triphosphoribosyl-dephospho-CoA synthase